MSDALVFPGQGSQSQGMQADMAAEFAVVRETWEEASGVLGFDLWSIVTDGPAEKLGETTVTQPAMLAAGFAAWRIWRAVNGETPTQVAGHSLGEYTALAAAGAVSFSDAMRVVKRRAELMQDAVPVGVGAMAAILGLDDDVVAGVCEQAAADEVAEAVNFNAPGQVVIAGHKTAIDRAIDLAKEAGARRALPLPVSVPAHSQLMRPAGEALADALAAADFVAPDVTVISASDATPYGDGDDIRRRLSRQVYSPVQWVSTVKALTSAGAETLIEAGPGKVLAGLVRRIDKTTPVATIDSIGGLEKALGE